MMHKEFDLAGYRQHMGRYLGGPDGAARVFWEALDFAVAAHAGQWRKSGDAYILHPCMVALILVEEMDIKDPEILAAALLHDTVEDVKEVTVEVIGERFGRNVEAIVDGCTKIVQYSGDRQTFYKKVHRKIFSGAAARLEVMLVKLADRLHNLRTLDAMPRDRRQKIAEETLDIYAPMAKVMGFFNMKRELYDLALKYKFPRQSHRVQVKIRQLEESPATQEIAATLSEQLRNSWIDCDITVRAKGLWGYFDTKNKRLYRTIDNPLEFILLVRDVHSCYQALGIVNQNYPPVPRTIRDFIANPKPTGYQGLHARANIKGLNYLFKIRTAAMGDAAQKGIIRGWSSHGDVAGIFEKELREMFNILGADEGLSPKDMIAASGKKEIYTFTPKGDRICLPQQSVVLDFAYQVHTDVGNCCIGAMVRQRRVGPDYVLKDGDQVKILRRDSPVLFDPHLQEICQTPRARSGLAKGFRIRQQALAKEIGRSIVMQELKRFGISAEILEDEKIKCVLDDLRLTSTEHLFLNVGEALVRLNSLADKIVEVFDPGRPLQYPSHDVRNQISLTSLDPVCVKFSSCCKPVPTDNGLIGILSERGLSIHRHDCPRFLSLNPKRRDAVEVRWLLKETGVVRPQTLFIEEATRNRILMLLAVAPVEMKISEIIALSRIDTKAPAWEINFAVATLHDLRNILSLVAKSGLPYEFILEQ